MLSNDAKSNGSRNLEFSKKIIRLVQTGPNRIKPDLLSLKIGQNFEFKVNVNFGSSFSDLTNNERSDVGRKWLFGKFFQR